MENENPSWQTDFILTTSAEEFEAARVLFLQYAASLDFDLCFQHFEEELETLHSMYGQPDGGILLVRERDTNAWVGCAGIRKMDGNIAELKRMYILEPARKKGLGRELLDRAVDLARELNYERLRLDTLPSMAQAIRLYEKAGFRRIKPYRFNPDPKAVFFELDLTVKPMPVLNNKTL